MTNTGNYSNDLVVTTPTPISFTATFTNLGSGAADGGRVIMEGMGYPYYQMYYTGFTILCTASGGAVCPTLTSGNTDYNLSGS